MILRFSYEMSDCFSRAVAEHHFSLMCIPRDTNRQRVLECHTEISPCSYQAEDRDFFGNRYVYGEAIQPHTEFHVRISGRVETGLSPEEHRDTDYLSMFRLQSAHTAPGPQLRDFHSRLKQSEPPDEYGRALYYMHAVHAAMTYAPAATDIHTAAEQAIILRRGVCQDYTHILLSLLRSSGLPARYVVGMMTGEGASHAWAEVNCRGYWYGLDPTNDYLVDAHYIKLSHGRDFEDCTPNKGVFRNLCTEEKQVRLTVVPVTA